MVTSLSLSIYTTSPTRMRYFDTLELLTRLHSGSGLPNPAQHPMACVEEWKAPSWSCFSFPQHAHIDECSKHLVWDQWYDILVETEPRH
jgi:hypothetical protein